MSQPAADMTRCARRLARLFKIERTKGFARWPTPVAARLIERRGALVEKLLLTEVTRSAELDQALAELAREVALGLRRARAGMDRIEGDLRARRESLSSGMRGDAGGRLLGRS